jgi:hypothetical protein
VIALYSLALLVSAALLFLLEPMVGKFVLPLLGSAPEVWPTTVLAPTGAHGIPSIGSWLSAGRLEWTGRGVWQVVDLHGERPSTLVPLFRQMATCLRRRQTAALSSHVNG